MEYLIFEAGITHEMLEVFEESLSAEDGAKVRRKRLEAKALWEAAGKRVPSMVSFGE